jgi:uncharacterized membrane protein YqaE (UPF0057 family)
MKRVATRFLLVLLIASTTASTVLAASLPVTVAPAANRAEPGPDAVKAAMKELKDLSRSERKSRFKEAKKLFKEYKTKKRKGYDDAETNLILLAILAILLPPLAVFLKEGELNAKFWIALVLTLLFLLFWPLWIIAVAYALLVVFDQL